MWVYVGAMVEMTEDVQNPARTKVVAAFLFQLAIALVAFSFPQRQMPLDYHGVLWVSLPLSMLWLGFMVVLAPSLRWRTLWTLLGFPMALYWPVWRLFHRIPACYWQHNCI